uniref:BamA/TamA family outer membrane protein n=1 Tax=Alistipes sp. TaxID=1872444 RepID=UPI004055F3C5
MREIILSFLVLLICSSVAAQNSEQQLVRENDTLTYTYIPLENPTPAVEAPIASDTTKRPGFFKRLVNYFAEANDDKTFEKKFDVSFIGGPSYSSTTKFGIGVMAAGLYRTDRTDSLTPPSDVTLFGSVSTSGFYTVGIRGNNLFKHDRHRLIYRLSFASQPTDFWGINYKACDTNPKAEYSEKLSRVELTYLARIARNFYLGPQAMFHYVKGINFSESEIGYLEGQNREYAATGLGAVIQYDSRDFAPNPYKGIYLAAGFKYFPEVLGSIEEPFWKVDFTLSGYQRLWESGILAAELHGEFNSEHTPWPFIARLGGDNRMRGYYEGRYSDLNMITLQVELRQRIWRRISGVVWGGAGNVFHSMDQFTWNHTLPNYGIGVRWEFKKRVNIRFDYGFGKHSNGLLVHINEAF